MTAAIAPAPAMQAGRPLPGVRGAARAPEDRMDATLFFIVIAIWANVWYWQLMIPGLASLRLGILSVVAALVAFVASGRPARLMSDPNRRPMQLTLGIGVMAILGGPFAIIRSEALNFLIYAYIPTVTLAMIVAARVQSEYALRVVLNAMLIGSLLYAKSFITAPLDSAGKPYGMPFYDANDGAVAFLLCLCLAMARSALARTTGGRVVILSGAMLCLGMVVRSSSRGAFVALAATIVLFLIFSRAVSVRRRLGVVISGIVLVTALGSSQYWKLMSTILEPEKDYNWAGNSDTGRIEMWKRGLTFMVQEPVIGVGARNYINKVGRSDWAKQLQAQGRGVGWKVAHNAYIEIGVELGIPGLIVFLSILGITARNLWRVARSPRTPPRFQLMCEYLIAALCAYSVGSIFLSSQYWTYFYVVIALSTSVCVVVKRQQAPAGPAPSPAARPLRRYRPPAPRVAPAHAG